MSNSTAAKVGSTSSKSSRRNKKTQEVKVSDTVTLDGAQAKQESSQNGDKGAQVIAMPQVKLQEVSKPEATPVALPPLPGNRPIASSDLNVSEGSSLPGNRPVDVSNVQIVGTISAMGDRPIGASPIEVRDIIAVSGNRPVAASHLKADATAMIMGNRPIASNEVDQEDLMGYLD